MLYVVSEALVVIKIHGKKTNGFCEEKEKRATTKKMSVNELKTDKQQTEYGFQSNGQF